MDQISNAHAAICFDARAGLLAWRPLGDADEATAWDMVQTLVSALPDNLQELWTTGRASSNVEADGWRPIAAAPPPAPRPPAEPELAVVQEAPVSPAGRR